MCPQRSLPTARQQLAAHPIEPQGLPQHPAQPHGAKATVPFDSHLVEPHLDARGYRGGCFKQLALITTAGDRARQRLRLRSPGGIQLAQVGHGFLAHLPAAAHRTHQLPVDVILTIFESRLMSQVQPTTSQPVAVFQPAGGAGKGLGRHYTCVCQTTVNDFKNFPCGLPRNSLPQRASCGSWARTRRCPRTRALPRSHRRQATPGCAAHAAPNPRAPAESGSPSGEPPLESCRSGRVRLKWIPPKPVNREYPLNF